MMRGIIIRKPDDMHFHPREGEMLKKVLKYTSKVFSRGVVMGNLRKTVKTSEDAKNFENEILSENPNFDPLMTIMLKKDTTSEILRQAFDDGIRLVKYMPDSSTTNSGDGIQLNKLLDEDRYAGLLEEMQDLGMFLLGHWTFPKPDGNFKDELEEERKAIIVLSNIVQQFPRLKITVEHVSTKAMVDFVIEASSNIAATITCHHACLDYRNVAGVLKNQVVNPYYYCKPVLNYPSDSRAIYQAMISGNPKFFFGSDSAPHPNTDKLKEIPAAGIFSAPVAMPLLCEIFERENKMHMLEDFVSRFGADHYGIQLNKGEIAIRRSSWTVPDEVEGIKVLFGGQTLNWHVA